MEEKTEKIEVKLTIAEERLSQLMTDLLIRTTAIEHFLVEKKVVTFEELRDKYTELSLNLLEIYKNFKDKTNEIT